ncbi:MAG: hypothetical protein MJ232_04740 [archaeon]|nr:hypothetical protein [archaeon]
MPFYYSSGEKGSRDKVNYVEKILRGETIDFKTLDEETLNDLVEDLLAAAEKEADIKKVEKYFAALEHIRLSFEFDAVQSNRFDAIDQKIVAASRREEGAPKPPREEKPETTYDAFDLLDKVMAKETVDFSKIPDKYLLRLTDLLLRETSRKTELKDLEFLMQQFDKINTELLKRKSSFRRDQADDIGKLADRIDELKREKGGKPEEPPRVEKPVGPEDEDDKLIRFIDEIYDKGTGVYHFERLTELEIIELLEIIVNKEVTEEADVVYLYNMAEKIVDYLSEKGIAIPEHVNNKYNELAEKYMRFRAPREEEAEPEEEEEEEEEDRRRDKKGKGDKKGKKSHKGIKITCIGVALVTLAVGGHHLASVLNHKSPYLFMHGKVYTEEVVRNQYNGDASDISTLTNENRVSVPTDVWNDEAILGVIHNFVSERYEILDYDIYEHTDAIVADYDYSMGQLMEIVLGGAPVEYYGHSAYFEDLSPAGKEHILNMISGLKKYYRNGATYTQQDVDDMVSQARLNMTRSK